MKPVIQTITGSPNGNCFQACLASILELQIEEVPEFRMMQNNGNSCMIEEADKWLRTEHGKRFICIEMYQNDGDSPRTDQCLVSRAFSSTDLVLLSGESPRKTKEGLPMYHCVIGRPMVWGFEVVHDPHPDGTGIVGQPYGLKWIVPIF